MISRIRAFAARHAKALRRARNANVAIIFALSAIPLTIAGGAGIDLARALAVRSKMYAAVDAAALAVASKSGITQDEANTLAQKYFDANYKLNSSFGSPTLKLPVTLGTNSVTIEVNNNMPTTLMNIAGFKDVPLKAASNVVWGQTKIWVGLALDTTGSMAQGDTTGTKIAALKTAVAGTNGLIQRLKSAAAVDGDVKMSLVPFAQDVNITDLIASTGGAATPWLDWTEYDNLHPTFGSCNITSKTTKPTCEGAGQCVLGAIGGNYTTQNTCIAASQGSCSVTTTYSQSNQTSCQNAGTCSFTSGSGSSGTQYSASNCTAAGTCTIAGKSPKSTCESAGTCSISGNTSKSACEAASIGTCSISGFFSASTCTAATAGSCSITVGSSQSSKTNCQNAGKCSLPAYLTKPTCIAAYASFTCTVNTTVYTDAAHDTATECTAASYCSKTPATTYNTKNKCIANPSPGTWYAGVFATGASGVWTAGVWTVTNGVWTATQYGVWTLGVWTPYVWTSQPGTWTVTYGVWTNTGVWTPDHSHWTGGCIMDRGLTASPANASGTVGQTTAGYDSTNAAPATTNTPQSRFPTEQTSCPAPIQKLNSNWTDMTTRVNALSTGGSTNQPIGLAWAWHSLTNTDPMNSGALPTNTSRFIIIVSDGENTRDRWWGNGTDHSNEVDDRMNLVCGAAKDDGVIIYSLFINIAGTAGNSSSMKNCASGGEFGGKYYEVSATGAIGNALDAIAQQITNMRVAH